MCGIFGAISKKNVVPIIKPALERLSYRGYDSAGIACLSDGVIKQNKCVGHPSNLDEDFVESNICIGHNRWATHGKPSIKNAHPHLSNSKKIALVHNGIIENYSELKTELLKYGFTFYSDTDTEIIPNLIEYYYEQNKDIEVAIKLAASRISGAYAIVFIHSDFKDKIFALNLGSPLCIGKSKNNIYISSDLNSLPIDTKKAIPIKDGNYLVVDVDCEFYCKSLSGKKSDIKLKNIKIDKGAHDLLNFDTFLEKEICEQKFTVKNLLRGRLLNKKGSIILAGILKDIDKIINAKEIIFTGCGSAFYAAEIGSHAMELYSRIRCRAIPAGELKYSNTVIDSGTVLVAVSQSGETADTIGCIKMANNRGATCIGIVNVPNSAIAREVSSGIHTRAGSEISVASTKAFLNQVVTLIMMAVLVGSKKDMCIELFEDIISELASLPANIESIVNSKGDIEKICEKYFNYKSILCIGRGPLYYAAKESALKIKEVSYIHAEGYSAAELKHGPLALISKDMPTISLVGNGLFCEKMLSNIREIKSRDGIILAVSTHNNYKKICDYVDDNVFIPEYKNEIIGLIYYIVVGQLLSLYLAKLNNCPIDTPRNLAKSVSVE